MKFRSLKILLLVFVALLVIVGIYISIQSKPKSSFPFANKEFNKIELKSGDTLCVFEKRATGGATSSWNIVKPVEYPVDTMIFNNLLEGLKNLKVGVVVSAREEKHKDFEVGDNGIKVKVFWDNRSKELIIGKIAGDFIHWYIRFPPNKETYLSTGLSKYILQKNVDDWRDHTIFSFDTSKVSELHLEDATQQYAEQKIARTDTGWIKGDTVISTSQINSILNLLSTLKCDGFREEDFEPKISFKIIFKDGTDKILYIGEKDTVAGGNKYPAKVKDNPTIFLLYQWKVDRLKNL